MFYWLPKPRGAPVAHWSDSEPLMPELPRPRFQFMTRPSGRRWTTFHSADYRFLPHKTAGVYVFYRDRRPIYIGRAQDLRKRMIAHRWKFGNCDYVKACILRRHEHRAWLEHRLISKLKPSCNAVIYRNAGGCLRRSEAY